MRFRRGIRPLRVVRILVYTYDGPERMLQDQAHWHHNHSDTSMEMRTASTMAEIVDDYVHPMEVELLRKVYAEARELCGQLALDGTDEMVSDTAAALDGTNGSIKALQSWYSQEDHTA